MPRAKFDETIRRVGLTGDVAHKSITAQDVTDEYMDLDMRLKNARAMRDRFQELLRRAEVKEAIEIQKELSKVTGEIELIEGRLKLLKDQIAYSTVTVTFQGRGASALRDMPLRLPFPWLSELGLPRLLNQEPSYDYRATSPEGVVFSVRHVDYPEEKGDLAFWTRAVTLQMRDVSGYALLDTKDATALDGTKGKALTFGHDEDGKPYLYLLTLYARGDRLFIIEAGGTRAQMERFGPSVTWMEKSVRVDCSIFLSPVLASRTCNRW